MLLRLTLIALLLSVSVRLHAGELLDRIVATVNTHVILQSDWDDEVRFECFMSGRNLKDVKPDEKKAALDRIIDQEILREQMRSAALKPVRSEEIKRQIDVLKHDQLREHAGESWARSLSRYQLTEEVLERRVAAELEQLQFVGTRFRPSIHISSGEIEKYYRDQVAPKLPVSATLTLSDATPKIREILIQQKINQLLNSWLETSRSQAQIRVVSADAASGARQADAQ